MLKYRRPPLSSCLAVLAGVVPCIAYAQPIADKGKLVMQSVAESRFSFGGFPGERIRCNIDRWLTVAPKENPGLFDMFARRDSGGTRGLAPWAGEFLGEYLISGVQAMRMSDDPRLRSTLQQVVDRLLQFQAEDGYLGPWPIKERLRGHWDLWGHYHIMLGLMLWNEQTGDPRAAAAVRRIADLVCRIFLDGKLRVADAGWEEMNMAIIHGMARLYRQTGNPRYLRMAEEVLKDFPRGGDYYRRGLAGEEFFRTPRPRWESLHTIQGLAELYRITGEAGYRQAFLHHWASMRRCDLRNTGGFSGGEQATGNPFRADVIETCCVIAWQEIMLDALRLTGDSTIADDLELATFNAVFASQHPSGAWCTYNTPVNGRRKPSHSILNNPDTPPDIPHVNCCAVTGPRGYGSLCHWALMRCDEGAVLNYLGPMRAEGRLRDGGPLTVSVETDYPLHGDIAIRVDTPTSRRFTLWLRIPAWSTRTEVAVGGEPVADVQSGRYLRLARIWQPGERITVRLDMGIRYESGDLEQFGKASIYRGPILLCSDTRFNKTPPTIDVGRLSKTVCRIGEAGQSDASKAAWVVVDVPDATSGAARLIDFASAGATTVDGKVLSEYVSWLPAIGLRPSRPVAELPYDGERIPPGPVRFTWRKPAPHSAESWQYELQIAESPGFSPVILHHLGGNGDGLLLPADRMGRLRPGTLYYWKIIARNPNGASESIAPYKSFVIAQ